MGNGQRRLRLTLLLSSLCFDIAFAFLARSSGAGGITRGVSGTTASPAGYHQSNDGGGIASTEKPLPARHPRAPQVREKPRNRRPRNYWLDPSNVEQEIRELWEWANVTTIIISEQQEQEQQTLPPPPIPNESLLNYWKRHDLRAAIATHGGREFLAEILGGAAIIPGKWDLAVQTPYVQQLLAQDPNLSSEFPPLSPQQLIKVQETLPGAVPVKEKRSTRNKISRWTASTTSNERQSNSISNRRLNRWYHQSDRKPSGYWNSKTIVIKELYEYLHERRQKENIPEGWMPRLSELKHAGRDDLALAIRRHGGQKAVCVRAGLVPFREWNYIEGMCELLLGLREYLDQYHGSDYSTFPIVSRVKEKGYDRLHSLIQYYGGLRFLAARLDMDYATSGTTRRRQASSMNKDQLVSADMSWGPFDLEFAIELYVFVRKQQMKMKPPLRHPEIRIPSQLNLLEYGGKGLWLDEKIQEYGGYENVARRLGLAFSFRNTL